MIPKGWERFQFRFILIHRLFPGYLHSLLSLVPSPGPFTCTPHLNTSLELLYLPQRVLEMASTRTHVGGAVHRLGGSSQAQTPVRTNEQAAESFVLIRAQVT
jgi:hypothetical protein